MTKKSKLSFNATSIRNLNDSEMAQVVGGDYNSFVVCPSGVNPTVANSCAQGCSAFCPPTVANCPSPSSPAATCPSPSSPAATCPPKPQSARPRCYEP
ncbi:MAG: TIGR04149 family rSAM-modified RiPP [Undibacterium sp.]|nr:TIGR04149 family rSAM-modified RiPP [Undibacterium sp.]